MMKIAVTGAKGEIGSRLIGLGYIPLNLDVTEPSSVKQELDRVRPDVVLHCAGISSVEECQKDYDQAIKVNARGTFNVCEEASEIGAKVVLLSSDYVFDGEKGSYKEEDEPNPVNNYGLTKMGAEAVIRVYSGKVIRLSRTFNINSKDIREYMRALVSGQEISVPDFLFRSYCHTDLIVRGLDFYLKNFDNMPETLHIAGKETFSYFGFVGFVTHGFGLQTLNLKPQEEDDNAFTPRPHKCGLNVDLAKSLGVPLFNILESVEQMKNEQ